eukprot:364448-Chlamydomonas_euryale.AAC.3
MMLRKMRCMRCMRLAARHIAAILSSNALQTSWEASAGSADMKRAKEIRADESTYIGNLRLFTGTEAACFQLASLLQHFVPAAEPDMCDHLFGPLLCDGDRCHRPAGRAAPWQSILRCRKLPGRQRMRVMRCSRPNAPRLRPDSLNHHCTMTQHSTYSDGAVAQCHAQGPTVWTAPLSVWCALMVGTTSSEGAAGCTFTAGSSVVVVYTIRSGATDEELQLAGQDVCDDLLAPPSLFDSCSVNVLPSRRRQMLQVCLSYLGLMESTSLKRTVTHPKTIMHYMYCTTVFSAVFSWWSPTVCGLWLAQVTPTRSFEITLGIQEDGTTEDIEEAIQKVATKNDATAGEAILVILIIPFLSS